jgi:hypothetical protein
LKDTLQTDIIPEEEELKKAPASDTNGKAPVKKENENKQMILPDDKQRNQNKKDSLK